MVEVDPAREPDMIGAGVLYILDDPTREEVLERAGIERARGLLCAVDSDAANVYITLRPGPATRTCSSSAGPPAPSRSTP
ncbi:MAG: NAD-binding protein [Actinomycetota bacterium]|nr:NAD-binding protein [Actinomycetota bacterium]